VRKHNARTRQETRHDRRTSRLKPRTDWRTGEAVIGKGLITREEFMQKISKERAAYRKLLNPTPQ
jgi:hypothetical protein